ncbi:helix-turn-helix domain-containing protein [Bacillus infantis]|uniref:helix-turn-helix domain-containing protein n=1 Tax=Bacillus infantis TaxID=324767 RepID=UPI003B97C392
MLTGKELKIKRILLEIEAQEIARHLEISKSYISLMEKGSRSIPERTYAKWITYLGSK